MYRTSCIFLSLLEKSNLDHGNLQKDKYLFVIVIITPILSVVVFVPETPNFYAYTPQPHIPHYSIDNLSLKIKNLPRYFGRPSQVSQISCKSFRLSLIRYRCLATNNH